MKFTPELDNSALIQSIRRRYQCACRDQLNKIFFASVDQNSDEHDKLMQELETSLYILYRFDRKLKNASTLEDLVASIGNDTPEGSSGDSSV